MACLQAGCGSLSAFCQGMENRHPRGDTVTDLFGDQGARRFGDLVADLHSPVQRPGVHDDRVFLHPGSTGRVESITRYVGIVDDSTAFGLNSEEVEDISGRQHFVEIGEAADGWVSGKRSTPSAGMA